MNNPEILVVFEPDAILLNIVDIADAHGWIEVEYFSRAERRNEEIIYELPDRETVVRGIEDQFVFVVFASIRGPNRDTAERALRAAGRALDDAVLRQWAEDADVKKRCFALRAFAAISDEVADPRTVKLYAAAVKDEHPEVRSALILAVGRAAWPELWPVVDDLAESGTTEADVLKRSYEKYIPRK